MERERVEQPRKRGVRRVVAWLGVAVVSLFALYVVGINVFLSTSLFEKVFNADPETLFVSYTRGWSIWPGRVHARHLTIRSGDRNVQFVLRAETCNFTFAVGDLLFRKTFHVTRVESSGVTFQGRQRIEAPAATPEYVEALPAIPGFERIPLRPLAPPDLAERWDDAHWHLWTVDLENVVAENVREVWVDGLRWEGHARVTGGFYLKPIRKVRLDDVHVDIHDGRVTVLRKLVAAPLAGSVGAAVTTFDPRTASLADIVHRVTLETELHGRCPDLANLPPRLTAPVALGGPAELRRIALHVVDGNVVSDTHLDIALPAASLEVAGHRAKGDLLLRADVAADAGAPRLTFRVDGHGLTASRIGDDSGLHVRAPSVEIRGDARALDLADPLRDLHAIATIAGAELPDARLLDAYVPARTRPTLAVEGGHAWARGTLELWLAERRAAGEGSLEAEALDLRVAKVRIRGATRVTGGFDAWRWEQERLEGVKAKVEIAHATIARWEDPDRAVLGARAIEVGLEAAVLALDDPLRAFSATVELPNGEILDEHLLRRYLPRGQQMRLTREHARFSARSALEVKDYKGEGTVALQASRVGLTFADLRIATDVRARARVHDWVWERGDLAIDEANVVLANVEMKRAGAAGSALRIPTITLRAASQRFDVSDPLTRLDLSASVVGGEVDDASAMNAFLPEGADVVFDGEPGQGRFDAELRASIDGGVARGTVVAHGRALGARGKTLGIRGNVEASAAIADWRIDQDRMRVNSSRIAFREVAVRMGDPDAPTPPALTASRVELQAHIDTLEMAHPSLHGVDYRLIVEDAHMSDLRPLGGLFTGDPLAFAVESGTARAAVDVTVKASAKSASGSASIVLENAGVRLHETRLVGDFQVAAVVNGFDPRIDGIDIAGSTVTMRNVRSTSSTAWNGEVKLLGGAVRVSASPAFDGFIQLHADDAKPLLALALQSSLPQFVVGMLKAPELSGQARITIEPGRTAFRDVHLRGGDVVLLASYVVAGDRVRGAATVAKGPLSAGVKVDDDRTSVRLFRLESWMKEEAAASQRLFDDTARGKAKAAPSPH